MSCGNAEVGAPNRARAPENRRLDSDTVLHATDTMPDPAGITKRRRDSAWPGGDHPGLGSAVRSAWAWTVSTTDTARCTCRKCHPGRLGGVIVFVEDAAEAVMSMDVQVGEPVRVGDRFG